MMMTDCQALDIR